MIQQLSNQGSVFLQMTLQLILTGYWSGGSLKPIAGSGLRTPGNSAMRFFWAGLINQGVASSFANGYC